MTAAQWVAELSSLSASGLPLKVFSALLALSLHWLLTRANLPSILRQAGTKLRAKSQGDAFADKELELRESRVEEELQKVTIRSWKYACRYLIHLHLLPLSRCIYEFHQEADTDSAGWLFWCVVVYAQWLPIATDVLELTHKRAKWSCAVIHVCVLGCTLSSAGRGKDNFLIRKDLISMAQLILAIMFPDPSLIFGFSLCFAAVYTWCFSSVSGPDALDAWFVMQQCYQIVTCTLLPAISVRMYRDCIEASLQSEGADSLVTAFRQMLRGVCDGDVLLDSDLRICGDASCLERLLGMKDSLTGHFFSDLIESERATAEFAQFLAASAFDDGRKSAPACVRVTLKGTTQTVAVDICHVSLRTQFGAKQHLLSLREDADARVRAEAEPGATPSCLLSSCSSSTSGPRSVSGMSTVSISQLETVEVFEELSQLTLVLNASTELIDVKEAYVRFSRHTDADKMKLGMPTMKRFIRPLDWHGVCTKLRHVARKAAKQQQSKPEKLPPLQLRLPGESSAYLRASKVTVQSMYQGPRPEGQPAYLNLQLSGFSEKPKATGARKTLEGVHEDTQHEGQLSASDAESGSGSAL